MTDVFGDIKTTLFLLLQVSLNAAEERLHGLLLPLLMTPGFPLLSTLTAEDEHPSSCFLHPLFGQMKSRCIVSHIKIEIPSRVPCVRKESSPTCMG